MSYEKDCKLNGIIYLHRISDPRMTGSARKNLFMFKKLCGPEGLKNVALVTTMWEHIASEDVGVDRERELIETQEFWGILKDRGATVKRHLNTAESARAILSTLLGNEKVTMDIQKELVKEHKSLIDTSAGMGLDQELQRQKAAFQRELEEAKESMREAIEARDADSEAMMKFYLEETESKIDRVTQDREKLRKEVEIERRKDRDLHDKQNEETQIQIRKLGKALDREKKRHEALESRLEQLQHLSTGGVEIRFNGDDVSFWQPKNNQRSKVALAEDRSKDKQRQKRNSAKRYEAPPYMLPAGESYKQTDGQASEGLSLNTTVASRGAGPVEIEWRDQRMLGGDNNSGTFANVSISLASPYYSFLGPRQFFL